MRIRDDDPPKEALRRLLACAGQLPLPGFGDFKSHLFAAKERFSVLRRLGVESLCLAQQARRVDSSLLLEVGGLTTIRLSAVVEALPDGSFSRESFFSLMHLQVESHREMDAAWTARTRGLQALVAAHNKLSLLGRTVPLAACEEAIAAARREAADCAVYIGFFLEALRRRVR